MRPRGFLYEWLEVRVHGQGLLAKAFLKKAPPHQKTQDVQAEPRYSPTQGQRFQATSRDWAQEGPQAVRYFVSDPASQHAHSTN